MGACSDEELAAMQPALREHWRDALAAYLLGYWAVSTPPLKRFISNQDDLSSYFLTDVWVSSAVNTNVVMQATASLQHYLHRLFARLDPGYLTNIIDQNTADLWREYLSEYGIWKIRQTQLNHPENLIYYANRPNKSSAFQSLEVELNQGKLDPELLQTAITGYLTKFEQTSNLQVVSGYLDGVDPKKDTYHFIGKTNASPPEYYWRSVDMGLHDDKHRLSPLAWSEWEKISVTPTGQIVQSTYRDSMATHSCDAIRPVMIEGRSYVFWVERGMVGLPSADDKNQTPTKFKKISVQYIYKQSDGFWSPPNELLCLDGTKDGKRLPDAGNAYLKDDTYVPGLIALVDAEGERAKDPWLRVMLYNCDYTANAGTAEPTKSGAFNKDYFIESRDLLLIDKKEITEKVAKVFSEKLYNAFSDIRKIQYPDSVNNKQIKLRATELGVMRYKLENYKHDSISSPNFDTTLRAEVEQHLKTISVNEVSKHGFASFAKKFPLISQLPFWVFYKRQGEFISFWSSDGRELTRDDFNKHSSSYKSPPLAWPGMFNCPPGMKNLVFPKKAWSATISAAQERDNLIKVTAHYSQQVIKLLTPELVSSATLKNDLPPPHNNHKFYIESKGGPSEGKLHFTYLMKLETSENVAIDARYLAVIKNEIISGNFEADESNASSLQIRTYSAPLDKAEYLLEDNFRIEFLIDGLWKSVPIKIVINPAAYEKIDLRLYAKRPDETSFHRLTEESVLADGQAVLSQEFTCTVSGQYIFALCEAGDPLHNVFATFDYRGFDAWNIAIKRNDQQAQYLDLNSVAEQSPTLPSNAIRLNTLFGKQLVARATRSVERALEWEAQCIEEPTIDENIPTPKVDFHGANGAYFRELFLHLPNLVATRLSEQQQFDEAERWYTHYLFDPYRTQEDDKERPPFWNTRPLAEVGSGNSELLKQINSTSRAFILSRYYRQAVFLALLENWQRQGDHFYRQLTPSTLNHAWLCYQKALKLIGPLPERASASRWVPMPLQSVNHSLFRAPINDRITTARRTLEHRLFNLRHGLTLDGKILPVMDWRTEGADPFGFGQRGVGQLISTYNSDRAQIPGYRFRQLIPMARAAVQRLQDLGRHYLKLLQDESDLALRVLIREQEIRICDFTLQIKQEAVNDEITARTLLEMSLEAAQFRRKHYEGLIATGRSPLEEAATATIWSTAILKIIAVPQESLAGITDALVPNIYGLAFGGTEHGAIIKAAATGLVLAAESGELVADQMLVESEYERRAQEWEFELKQTEFDIKSLEFEISEADIERNAATLSLDEARAHRANLETIYETMTTGFISAPVYRWLAARQALLYGPAYDAVLSLCLSAEAAWRYEIGDYKRPAFIKPSAWIDNYKGMLAGESLLVDLLEMENAYVQNNERRLTIKKTITLWDALKVANTESAQGLFTTPLTLSIKSADFDSNYAGHYLRQLKHVSVSFVMSSDAGDTMREISAILTQTDSTTLVEPTTDGADYLYKPTPKPPLSVKRNLRVQQQIALSSTVADDGLGFSVGDWVYELMFHDGRYLPFEGTGAISGWQLSFPDEAFRKELAKDVKSIQLHLVYTAVDGGKEFSETVKNLLSTAKKP